MGPRNRRRLRAAALGAAAVIVVVVWLLQSPSHSHPAQRSSGSSGSGPSNYYGSEMPVTGKLSYGMTAAQVRRIDGRPARVVRFEGLSCWQYGVHISSPAKGPFPAMTTTAIRVCFVNGSYSLNHLKTNGLWDYRPAGALG